MLSLHCPPSPATQGMIAAPQLASMKRDAVLINTARGALVDPLALADALRAGRLGGAAVDVLQQEPPLDGNPLLANDIPNLIVTPTPNDDQAHIVYPFGVRQQDWANDLPILVKRWPE